MHLTMSDIMPVGLCLATQELFDARRFQQNFCDHSLLRARTEEMDSVLWPIKKELGSSATQKKYIEGHKAVIISNIDKILSLVTARYSSMNLRSIEALVKEGRTIMRKVLMADNFEEINFLEPTFKTKIVLPVYELFLENQKRSERLV